MDEQERVFRIWAPIGVTWTQWAKPVLFTRVPTDGAVSVIEATELALPPSDGRSAVVVDMPAIESIRVGVALAGRGYRPVPLFNALPGPSHEYFSTPTPAAVDLQEVPTALTSAANALASLQLPATAPPAFLLDANRRGSSDRPSAGTFDNRSVSLTTDFPSANVLLNAGLERVVLISLREAPQADLAHTLLRWQEASLKIERVDATKQQLSAITIRKPPLYRMMFQRLMDTFGLRRSPFGGFGAMLPTPSAG